MQLVNLYIRGVFFLFFSKERERESDEGGVCIYKHILENKKEKKSVLVKRRSRNNNCLEFLTFRT